MPPIPTPSSLLSPLALALCPAILCPLSHPCPARLPEGPGGPTGHLSGVPAEGEAARGELGALWPPCEVGNPVGPLVPFSAEWGALPDLLG